MAAGDITIFKQFLTDIGNSVHNLSTATLKLGVVTSTAAPTATTANPCWGSGGSTNLSTNQVATAGTSYTGPVTLSSVTWTNVSNVATLRAGTVTINQDASGFTNGRYGIIYNDTATNKNAIAFVDFGSDTSIASAAFTIDWNGTTNDILTIS